MDKIIEIEPSELAYVLGELTGSKNLPGSLYKLRICIQGDQVKFKANEGTWTASVGHLDPMCPAGMRLRHNESHGV